jgi:hypothetical protein
MPPENPPPDFYLSTAGEYEPLAAPRACWNIARLRDGTRDDWMLVAVEPVLVGQRFGLGPSDISHLIIGTKLQGQSLFPISQWPVYVYVARVLEDSVLRTQVFEKQQVELIAWGMLFRTHDEALAVARRSQQSGTKARS